MNKAELIERLEWHARHQRNCHRTQHAEGLQNAVQIVRNCLDGDPPVETQRELSAALRQYRHNDGTPGFVYAYETTRVDRLVERLAREPDRGENAPVKVTREVNDPLHHPDDPISNCDLTVGDIRQALARKPVNIVFDGPPSAAAPRFIEVENDNGESIRVGEWIEREDGFWALRIT